jgi:hypothetical protein
MKRLIAVTLTVLFVVAGSAIAQPRRGPGPAGGPPPGMAGGPPGMSGADASKALAVYLGLTEQQQEQWESIQRETRESGRALHEQMRTLAEQLEDSNDANQIGSIVLQLRNIQSQLKAAHDAAQARFAATLTSDQQAKFAAFQAAIEFLGRRGPGGGRPR